MSDDDEDDEVIEYKYVPCKRPKATDTEYAFIMLAVVGAPNVGIRHQSLSASLSGSLQTIDSQRSASTMCRCAS